MRKISPWLPVVGIGALAALVGACTFLLDHNDVQCNTDSDCAKFDGHPYCMQNVCVPSGLGPEGCFFGTPDAQLEYENQCSTATCDPFDNCTRLGLCGDAALPTAVNPPPIDAAPDAAPADAALVDAAPPPTPTACVNPSERNTVVVGGSTAIQPFLSVMAPLLAANSPPYQIAYQPSGSCTGVDGLFSSDPSKHVIKDIKGKQALLFHTDGTSENCTFGNGTTLDVSASDVFASTCNSTYALGTTLAEYLGPIQPMTFVVPASSTETAMSAEMAHIVFGLGSTSTKDTPYKTPSLYFIRNSGSGTQQMISRAVGLDPTKWWGKDRGSSGGVRDQMEAINPADAPQAIGILSTDFADPERQRLKILAFKATGQDCGYLPDETAFTRDKRNVRDGHYQIWGPEHFFAAVSGGIPNAAASAFVTRFSFTRLDQALLDAITKSGLVPACAMAVQRTSEMGPLMPYSPQGACGCYFEANVPGGTAPSTCTACTGPADCMNVPGKPACNSGYCEAQ